MSNGTQPCARAAASRQMGSPVTGSAMASRAAIQCDFQGEFASVTLSVTWPYCQKARSEEHTSELQSLMRISYAVFCLKKKKKTQNRQYEKYYHNDEQRRPHTKQP